MVMVMVAPVTEIEAEAEEIDFESSDVELTSLVNAGQRSERGVCDGPPSAADEVSPGKSRATGKATRLLFLLLCGVMLALMLRHSSRVESRSSAASASHEISSTNTNDTDSDNSETSVGVLWSTLRWKPVGDECYPGFRLANATLHCGVGDRDQPPLTTVEGTRYCGGVELEPNSCILPTEGRWEIPSRGGEVPVSPLHVRFGTHSNSSNSKLPRCKTMDQVTNGSLAAGGEWVPHTCSLVPMSPFVWTEHAQCQTTITMIGDSHIRNLFSATVHGLRGADAFVEGHSEVAKATGEVRSYEWRLRGGVATDQARVHLGTNREEPAPFEDCPCGEVQRCLRIAFVWAPTFGEQRTPMAWAEKWRSDLIVAAPGNSYEASIALSPAWTSALDDLLTRRPRTHLALLHFVWGKQPPERPAALAAWMSEGAGAARMSYLPQSAIMDAKNKQSRATWHFACGLEKVNVVNDMINAAEPCSDITDTSQIRAIVTVHFDAFLNETESP